MKDCRMDRCFYCKQTQTILMTKRDSGFFSGHLRVMLRSLLFQETDLPHRYYLSFSLQSYFG